MRIVSVSGSELFVAGPRQVVLVQVEDPPGELVITGAGVAGRASVRSGTLVEVPVDCAAPPGTVVPIRVTADGTHTVETSHVVAEPGWTVWMVSHFHYDPVWWNTQAAYTAMWDREGRLGTGFRADFQQTGFALVRLHLETARRDPDYAFVLAELDYLKPYWDSHPEDRAYLRSLIADGRLELMGGTYNEPNTNLTSAESTIRNLVHGVGFQRDVVGGDPRTAWQLDAFGHDPQFPGLVADAGLDSSSWARGPFHQWGPMLWTHEPRDDGWGDPSVMQFSSEFEWVSPSGRGVLTHYMPAHYSAGWRIDSQPTLAGAESCVYDLFLLLKKVAATRNVLLPVGTDYTPPARWVTEIHRDWNARYVSPRFVCGLPKDFFSAVRGQLRTSDTRPTAQTRDMNPVYTGKDVSFIDTKQAQRHTEALLVDAEMFATIAAAHGAPYPHAPIDKAWRQLVYGAHHDAITGSESDQVYLDLLTGWREAHDIATSVLTGALDQLGSTMDGAGPGRRIVVFNPSAWPRTDLVRVRVDFPAPGTAGVTVADLPVLLEHPRYHDDGTLAAVDVVFRAVDVPSVGHRSWALTGTGPAEGWSTVDAPPVIANDTYRLTVDPARGGCVAGLTDLRTGREILQPGRVGNELLVYDEYAAHPRFHEGPWHLLPKGAAVDGSARRAADTVRVEHSPLGRRITVTGTVGPLRYTQTLTLWVGVDRLDATTTVDDFTGADHLVRLRWPAAVHGGLPVSEVGDAVVGRGYGLIDVDSEHAPWTLDNPAQHWFAVSSTARVEVCDPAGTRQYTRAVGIAEIIADGDVRDLAVALVRQGVSATTSTPAGARYGRLAVDSNLPDVRICVGEHAFTTAVLDAAGPGYADEFTRQLAGTGRVRLWVPAAKALTEVWVPDADLTGLQDLPVLIVAGAGAVEALCAELDEGTVRVRQPESGTPDPDLDDYTVGLVNRGIPGFAVDPTGALHLSLLRSCTGWPSGVWIDPPRRTAPDGSTFQQQHWTHRFDYSLVAGPGDWRATGLVRHGHQVNRPLHALVREGVPVPAHSFVTVEPADHLVLAALKPTGNPFAGGRLPESAVDSVTVRLYESAGRPADAEVRLWSAPADAVTANVLEEAGAALSIVDGAVRVPLSGADIRQTLVRVDPLPSAAPAPRPGYARYWLHNSGPAPVGNLPVTVHLDPPTAVASGPVTLTVTVTSGLTRDRAAGPVDLHLPDGFHAEPAALRYDLAPGGHVRQPVVVTPTDGDGVYWVRARLDSGIEDVARLLVGVDGPETVEAVPCAAPRLRPGDETTVELDLRTDAASSVTVDVNLISPWHTWDLFPLAETRVELPPRGSTRLRLPVRVPAGHEPGRWWALFKIAYAGELHYTAPIEIEVVP